MKVKISFDFSPSALLERAFCPGGAMSGCGKASKRLEAIARQIIDADVFLTHESMSVELDEGDWRVLKDGLIMAGINNRSMMPWTQHLQWMVMNISDSLGDKS